MVTTLEKAIPQSEVQRIFRDYLESQQDLINGERDKALIMEELLCREKEMKQLPKKH